MLSKGPFTRAISESEFAVVLPKKRTRVTKRSPVLWSFLTNLVSENAFFCKIGMEIARANAASF
jgi:hypothetical protein